MDFQSVRKKTDWKSILRFAKPQIVSGQFLRLRRDKLVGASKEQTAESETSPGGEGELDHQQPSLALK